MNVHLNVLPDSDWPARPPAAPRPAAPTPAVTGGLLVEFLLMPGFPMLAVSAALEPLTRANTVLRHDTFRWRFVSADGRPVLCQEGWEVTVQGAPDPQSAAGLTLICAAESSETDAPPFVTDHLRRQWRMGRIVGGLCAGSMALAQAGILRGSRIALHWAQAPGFLTRWPETKITEGTFCIDDRIITCAGPLAAADLMLQIVYDRHGADISQKVMDLCLMKSRRAAEDAQTASLAPRLACRNSNLLRAVAWIDRNFLDEFCLEGCATAALISPRQVQRLFKKHVGKSPMQYMTKRRLDYARRLLVETDLSVREVAERCGFSSDSNFSKGFRKVFGFAPSKAANFLTKSDTAARLF